MRPVGHTRWMLDDPIIYNAPAQIDPGHLSLPERVRYLGYGIDFSLLKPKGWEVYTASDGIVLVERMGSIKTGGQLEGLVIQVFVPALDDFDLPQAGEANLAYSVLRQVTRTRRYIGKGLVTTPAAFQWSGQDAAYYLLNNGNGGMAIVIGLTTPRSNKLLAFNISAPLREATSIRGKLPALLDELIIDGVMLDSADLEHLPDPLNFPQPRQDPVGVMLR